MIQADQDTSDRLAALTPWIHTAIISLNFTAVNGRRGQLVLGSRRISISVYWLLTGIFFRRSRIFC